MKKLMMTLCAAIAVMGMFTSCNKDNSSKKGGDENNENEWKATIDIDGNFDDWASAKDVVTVNVPKGGYIGDGVTLGKVVADEYYLYLYTEFAVDMTAFQSRGTVCAPVDIFINSDGNNTTGYSSWLFSEDGAGYEYLVETEAGIIKSATEVADFSDVSVFYKKKDSAPNLVDGWSGEAVSAKPTDEATTQAGFLKVSVSNAVNCAGKISNGIAKTEIRILRTAVNLTGTKGAVAFKIYKADWSDFGMWPQKTMVDGKIDPVAMQAFTLPALGE